MRRAFLIVLCLAAHVIAHGALRTPTPRTTTVAPVGVATSSFRCRSDTKTSPASPVTAGQTMAVEWSMPAAHPGDCSVYMTYDDASTAGAQWFKLADYKNCHQMNNQPQNLALPSWLKSGPAVFRWEWVALSGGIGYYAQCSDVTVGGGGNDIGSPTVSIPGHLPTTLAGFRNIDGTGNQAIVGPAIAVRAGSAPVAAPIPCTTDADCTSKVCKIEGFCFVEPANHAIGATVFFLLAFIACAAVLAYVLVTKKDALFNKQNSASTSTRFDEIDA